MSFSVIEMVIITQIKARAVHYNVKNTGLEYNPILIIFLLPFQVFLLRQGPKLATLP